MRWKRSSQGSFRLSWFGRLKRRIINEDESDEERATRRRGKIFAFLIRGKKETVPEQRNQLSASEEDLEAWMQMRKERPRRRNPSEQHSSGALVSEQGGGILRVVNRSISHERVEQSRELRTREVDSEEETAWKVRLLRQEGDIETLNNTIEQLRSQLGKKSTECIELRRELDRVDSLKKGGKNRSSVISQDESFQTVIFPVQSTKRASTRRRVDSAPIPYGLLKKRNFGTQTETYESTEVICSNESCRIQILKMKRESNSLKMQMADSEDIILGLELDHDALRKYLTQTELKLQKSEEEVQTVKKSLEDQEQHYKCIIAGYDERLNSLKGQNDKLSSKLFALINRRPRFPSDDKLEKKEVGIQALTQFSMIDNPMMTAEAVYQSQAVKPRKGRYSTGQLSFISKNDKERLWAKRNQTSAHKCSKSMSSSFGVRDPHCTTEAGPEQWCPSSDNSLEHEITRRIRSGKKVDVFEREDSGLETDMSYISADNEHDRGGALITRKMVMSGEYQDVLIDSLREEPVTVPQRMRRGDCNDSDAEKCSIWKQDIMSQLSHLGYVIEKHHGKGSYSSDTLNEHKTNMGAKSFQTSQQTGMRQSWHEPSLRQQVVTREEYFRQQGKLSNAIPAMQRESTESTEEFTDDYYYFR